MLLQIVLLLAEHLQLDVQALQQIVGLDYQVARLDHLAPNIAKLLFDLGFGFKSHGTPS